MLEEALSSDYEPQQSPRLNSSLKEQEEQEQQNCWEEELEEESVVYKELVPVIGYVSPR